ncbi:geranylgeranyl pyrophosphate synthetase [Paramarasmius palmivorus]|uniref:Ubiquitin-conjugating enzyme E2 1 n=1 Tax=Paramarasmius palmivorus TaxID=297713 RepID=A0AAW0D2E9_9AGAR
MSRSHDDVLERTPTPESPVNTHRPDWPAPGVQVKKMSEIDLPRRSSGTEWWYYNFHLTLVDGRQASAFIALFRVTSLRPKSREDDNSTEDYALTHTHFVHFAISLAPTEMNEGRYLFTSAMDPDNASYLQTLLEFDRRVDPLLQNALVELLRRGSVPEPDTFIEGDITVAETGPLKLVYGNTASVECITNNQGNEIYRIMARSKDGSYGFELDLEPKKVPVNHGTDGVVHGHKMDNDEMYYCFVSRCAVSGSIRVDSVETSVDSTPGLSTGWYDRELGGSINAWDQPNNKSSEGSWVWGSVQLSNGWDLTFFTVWDVDVYTGEKDVRDRTAIAISPEGERVQCSEHIFECQDSWTSLETLNEYGTKWRLTIPRLEIDVSVHAPFAMQESKSLCAVRGYWEGRVDIAGTMLGREVSGLGFVENVPAQLVTKLTNYLKLMGSLTVTEVRKVYPEKLIDSSHAADVLGLDQTTQKLVSTPAEQVSLQPTRFTQDLPLNVLHQHLLAPVRHITERGGKSWRSFISVACISAFGKSPEPFKPLLAAVELLHTGSLIIDDIQDESPTRRGVTAVHRTWGIPTAINAGTAAYFAFEQAMRAISKHVRSDRVINLYETYFETMRAAHAGQALDIAGNRLEDLSSILDGRNPPSVLEKQVLAIHRLKTAIIAANIAKMSAMIADASPGQTLALVEYIERVGIAFQIMDDVYDLRGWSHQAQKKVLKRRGDDIRSGKINIPIAKAGYMMPLEDARWVWETVLSKPSEDEELVQAVIEKLESHGIVDQCEKEAHQMVEDAWAKMESYLSDSQAKVHLRALDCKNDKTSNITLDLVDNSPFHLKGSFTGPEGTPYEGGHFEVDIVIPDAYPFQPVKMKFITKVYHPNVSSASGAICLDILKDAWSPVLTLKSTLISLQSLLCSPEPNDPQDAEVAKHYTTSKSSFDETARYWTQIYAGGPGNKAAPSPGKVDTKSGPRDEVAIAGLEKAHVDQFESLGFPRSKVIDVLRRMNYRGANVAQISEDRIVEELLK